MTQRIVLSVDKMDAAFTAMRDTLSRHATVEVVGLEGYSLQGADLFIGKKMGENELASADRLRAVFAYKTGVDDFPVHAFAKRGISLYNSHINSGYIAHYAFGLAVTLVSRIAEFDRKMRRGDWANDDPYWRSLFMMKAGLVGYGHIGREIGALLLANGIETYTIDRGKAYPGVHTVPSLEALCEVSDVLFLSLPKTAETDKMFHAGIFPLLRGKYLVNVGRSNCIDEPALYAALTEGGMAGAAIDTWREKSRNVGEVFYPFSCPFDRLENVLLSSHKAMQLRDGHDRYVEDITQQVVAYLGGTLTRPPVNCLRGY